MKARQARTSPAAHPPRLQDIEACRCLHASLSRSPALSLAIGQLHLGNYYDTDGTSPGTQPPEPLPQPEPETHAGRLVSRLVKTVQELDTWRADWAAAKRDRLRHDQRERYKAALAELKAKVAAMEEELG